MSISQSKIRNIILDLDSTVINSLRPWEKQPKGFVSYEMKDDDQIEFVVYERPHLQEFLDFLFSNYRVAVWTAASKDYAIFIIENILLQKKPERKLEFFLFDYHGDFCEDCGRSPKDLQLVYDTFSGFTKNNTIIVDDYEEVYMPQMCNAYPIPPFIVNLPQASKDIELIKLMRRLSEVSISSGKCPTDNLVTESTLQKALAKAKAEAKAETERAES